MSCHGKQVSDDGYRSSSEPAIKRSRVTAAVAQQSQRSDKNGTYCCNETPAMKAPRPSSPRSPVLSLRPEEASGTTVIKPPYFPRNSRKASGATRAPSPSLSTSSSFSGVTTSAALSSRASLSSCRSSVRDCGGGRSHYAVGSSSSSFSRKSTLPTKSPSLWEHSDSRRRWDGTSGAGAGGGERRNYSRRDRSNTRRGSDRNWDGDIQRRSEWSTAAYGGSSRGSAQGRDERSRTRGYKRSRSCSRERGGAGSRGCGGVECSRCLKWCRASREQKPITRTLAMEYWVRTPACKAAKSKHIEYIDNVAYSREQFIEETVFTCPFTGVQRDTLLERNMFPYDVPTDVEHWTLWSRKDLSESEMEEFVTMWAAENHPHAVEWECDNNEGDRSIDWYHVHVFFRLGCKDKSGARRDPDSAYNGPCGSAPIEMATSGDGGVEQTEENLEN